MRNNTEGIIRKQEK